MALFRYALLDILRGHRRTFSSILGVLLAITFLSGTFIAIDSSARATLEGLLQGVRGDFQLTAFGGNPLHLRDALLANPEVVNASVYARTFAEAYREDPAWEEPRAMGVDVWAVDPERLPTRIQYRDLEIMGPFDLANGTVAISSGLASSLNLERNDTLALRHSVGFNSDGPRYAWLNLTVRALVAAPSGDVAFDHILDRFAFIHIRDLPWFQDQLSFTGERDDIQAEVWIDRDRFINPYDIDESLRRLTRFERELSSDLRQEGFFVDIHDNLSSRLSTYDSQIAMQRVVYLLLSLPVLLLGLYLGAVGVDLGHAERRRELAVLKARGASGTQVLGLLLLGAVLGGLVATVLGLLAGVALSRLLLSVVNPFALSVAPALGDLVLQVNTVLYVTLFSVGFMLVASYRSARRTAGLPVAETLRYYAPGETKIAYRPTTDVLLVTLGALFLILVWYLRFHAGTFFSFLLAIFGVILPLVLAPIFLIVGTTRLLTRSTGKVYEWAARLWKPITGNLYAVISRTLSRNPRRSASVAVIIALGLAFGMFIFAFLGSTMAYSTRTLRAEIGADLRVYSLPAEDAGFAANVSQVEGVAGVSPATAFSAQVYGTSVDLYAVDPETHFAVTQPESWWFDGLSAGSAADILRTEGGVLASQRLADETYLEAGDRLPLVATTYDPGTGEGVEVEVNVTVGGVVRGLPGTSRSGFSLPRALYGSFETLAPLFPLGKDQPPPTFGAAYLLVDLEPGAAWGEVETAIQDLGGSRIAVYEERLEQRMNDPVFRSILGFIGLEVAFIVIIITAGLGLILFAATLERDVEFAAIRARGASAWQTAGLLVGEATGILLVGLAVGVAVGLLVAYFVLQITVLAAPGGLAPLVPFLFELAPEGWLLVVLAPAALLGTALLIALRVAHMNVARVLKIRGG